MTEEKESPQDDDRAAEKPAGDGESEGEGGPMGDPSQDEEALSHKQQEQDPPDDD